MVETESRAIDLSPEELKAAESLAKDPLDSKAKYALNSAYWRRINGLIKEAAAGGKKNELAFATSVLNYINYGYISKDLLDDESPVPARIEEGRIPLGEEGGTYYYFSEWLKLRYKELLNFNKKEEIKKKIEATEQEIMRAEGDLNETQRNRKARLSEGIKEALNARNMFTASGYNSILARAESLETRDELFYESLKRKDRIKRGVFMSLEERRKHLQSEKDLDAIQIQCAAVFSELGSKESETSVRKMCERVDSLYKRIIELNERLKRFNNDFSKIAEETDSLSAVEVENKLEEEIDYIKNLVKLSANRLRLEPVSVAFGKSDIAIKKSVFDIMERIDEFDPRLYRNTRVSFYGKPSVVIVPGMGNGVYDWKNNALIIPTIPYSTLDVSVIGAVVEYRIDVDEDKKMMFGYNQIKEYAGIRSVWALREKFLKDYTIWMLQEYKGYKVLKKDVRDWFEHDIGPNKNEWITPLKYATFMMSQKEFGQYCKDLEKQLEKEGGEDYEGLFRMAIVHCQKEEWDKAVKSFAKALKLRPTCRYALYDLAFACMKNHMKPNAVKYFTLFMTKNPSSWWSGVARSYLTRLR